MALDLDAGGAILLQPVGVGAQNIVVLRLNCVIVVTEVDVLERTLITLAECPLLKFAQRASAAGAYTRTRQIAHTSGAARAAGTRLVLFGGAAEERERHQERRDRCRTG